MVQLQLIEINKLEVIGSDNMYDDIIDIKYPFDLGHVRMSNYERCAQFMPFSALTGYGDAVKETARITNDKIILDEELKEVLDNKLCLIKNMFSLKPVVSITYFVPDKIKSGGKYESVLGVVKKIDLYNNIVIINDKKIFIENIINITGDIFDKI